MGGRLDGGCNLGPAPQELAEHGCFCLLAMLVIIQFMTSAGTAPKRPSTTAGTSLAHGSVVCEATDSTREDEALRVPTAEREQRRA